MGRLTLFSDSVVGSIKEHLDQHRGPEGGYILDYHATLEDLQSFLQVRHPDEREFSTTQLERKISGLATTQRMKRRPFLLSTARLVDRAEYGSGFSYNFLRVLG